MPADYVVAIVIVGMSLSSVTLWIWMVMRKKRQGDAPAAAALAAVEQRLARLEVAVDDMATALAQVTEGQHFVTKVLTDRAADRATLPR
jgi:hypothetical protein